jgi:hypothetical protein
MYILFFFTGLLFSCEPGKQIYIANYTDNEYYATVELKKNEMYNTYAELIKDSILFSKNFKIKAENWDISDSLKSKQKIVGINDSTFSFKLYGKSVTLIGPVTYFPMRQLVLLSYKDSMNINFYSKKHWKQYKRNGIVMQKWFFDNKVIINVTPADAECAVSKE